MMLTTSSSVVLEAASAAEGLGGAFTQHAFEVLTADGAVRREPRYGIWWVEEGEGTCRIDFRTHAYRPGTLVFLSPFQPFAFQPTTPTRGQRVAFTPEFFCIERHRQEVGCSGVLFNTLYEAPVLPLGALDAATLTLGWEQMQHELTRGGLAQDDALMAMLKVFLIQATRLKLAQTAPLTTAPVEAPPVVARLRDLIEQHYRTRRTAHEYAELVHLTPKALGRVVRQHFGRSVSELIQERVVMEAKRELFLTTAPVKQIAYDLGFDDPAHFSRYFRNVAGVSAEGYRRGVRGY